MNYQCLGRTILSYRKKNNMTIREFSDYSGISTSLISQIERGKANPSLNVLELIAKALNVPLFTLFINDIDTDSLISKKHDRKKIYRENNDHIVYDVLTPDFMKANIELLIMDLNANVSTTESHYSHIAKEEIAVVMKGQVYVELEGIEYFLEEGDVVRIPPNVRHRFINKSNQTNNILFVLTPSLI
ncbi:helix-turn-helix domain-containing protein [Clostridium botulinum]|uniref:helix-turn-helix domain-containing protein n=1 Tax=Clostridium sp. ZBS13 TaxID=2949971 RepID=UPI0005018AD0|nr:XRE family transcriptional regulator [Clostridium sp. ZBS13]KFX57209.1 DNA-binding protein [Clostridium botulinum]MBY6802494.1 helix-turn-helix transcriptional regulator [Clostridium botulinum]MBY6812631.1 helix-turn-helix transcriptional regulator [Clostridium botulinum]MBY6819261.1 helix-turn-helix transcriptional regulator [Clostridium botulinum]NFJ50676.1 helix-turn-helix domain-containing protein [Clostridium botulinum]